MLPARTTFAAIASVFVVLVASACAGPPSPEEYLPRLAECLRDAGYDAEMMDDGSLRYDYGSQDRRAAFMQARDACDRAIGTPAQPEPLSEAEIRARYAYLVDMRVCLMRLGYAISTPPPVDTFVDKWDTGPWSPYNDVPGSALGEIEQRCPQVPDEEWDAA